MALPTLTVTPGIGQTINTLQVSGQATPANSHPFTLDNNVETAPGFPGGLALTVQGNTSGIAVPVSLASAVQTAPGAAGTAAVTIQGNASGLPVPIVGQIVKKLTAFGPGSSTTYTNGQVLLGTTQLTGVSRVSNGSVVLFGAQLGLNALNANQVDVITFTSLPSGTYTAAATFTLSSTDIPKLGPVLHIDDWTATGAASSVGQLSNTGTKLVTCDDGTSLTSIWIVLVARGSITLAAATDGQFTLRASQN